MSEIIKYYYENRFFPKTKLGKWAIGLMALWPLLTILGSAIVNILYPEIEVGSGIIDDLRARPALAMAMLLDITSGLISFPMILMAIFKNRERSLLVYFAALFGLFLIVLLVGEIFIRH